MVSCSSLLQSGAATLSGSRSESLGLSRLQLAAQEKVNCANTELEAVLLVHGAGNLLPAEVCVWSRGVS